MAEYGTEPGELCDRDGCTGILEMHQDGDCSCHIAPPCSACVGAYPCCPVCGWEPELTTLNDHSVREAESGRVWDMGPRKLDRSKIDYRVECHTHFSQRCIGVYPEGTTQEQVRAVVDGTFGGRFTHFGGGEFEYIAYTD